LIELIEVDFVLKEELEQYDDELSEMNFWTCNFMWGYIYFKKCSILLFGMLRYSININVDKYQAILKSDVRLIKIFISL
jgi:hypothetical protein